MNDVDPKREWYGRFRGSDGDFSFSPFAPQSISHNGASLKVIMNKLLVAAGVLEKYDAGKHAEERYQLLK